MFSTLASQISARCVANCSLKRSVLEQVWRLFPHPGDCRPLLLNRLVEAAPFLPAIMHIDTGPLPLVLRMTDWRAIRQSCDYGLERREGTPGE